jgi:uncharacterized membrane protein
VLEKSGPTPCPTCHQPLPDPAAPTAEAAPEAHHLQVHTRNENALLGRLRRDQDRVTDLITTFAGSLKFVYIHTLWFGLWILANAGLLGAGVVFDKFPYGLLTMIVSLEAIFLSTFVMVSQNRQSARADVRAELDFETNLRSEIWALHIGRRLGLDPHDIERHVQTIIQVSKQEISGPPDGDAHDAFDPDSV